MDGNGLALTGIVQPTDFIRIELPGLKIGRGFDWVAVEELSGGDYWVRMIVRPCADPTAPEDTTAHFLKEEATSTFEVKLEDLTVSSIILGKNEKPNDESKGLLQKTRDFLVGIRRYCRRIRHSMEYACKRLFGRRDRLSRKAVWLLLIKGLCETRLLATIGFNYDREELRPYVISLYGGFNREDFSDLRLNIKQ